jgi:hypothetical protein
VGLWGEFVPERLGSERGRWQLIGRVGTFFFQRATRTISRNTSGAKSPRSSRQIYRSGEALRHPQSGSVLIQDKTKIEFAPEICSTQNQIAEYQTEHRAAAPAIPESAP